ncbi:MAG: magnesium/cobalt transporter CorA [Candidatus Omnitrophica bacterium]|nr:magnesium/cobalt transporter CorA [Candidatus Omnitrophota bacterium]
MIHSFIYRKNKPLQINVSRQDLAKAVWDKDAFVWVDLEEPTEFESETLIEIFNFHPLAVEDCINDLSQPKVDDYEEYLFLVVHAINMKSREEVSTVELDIFLNKNYVVTVHKQAIRSVEQVCETVSKKGSSYFGNGIEMLVHALLDRLVDNFMPVLNQFEEKIDAIENEIFQESSPAFLDRILRVQKDIWYLRRIVGPQRDTINHLSRNASAFIRQKNLIYFRDVYDHLFQIYQSVESSHEILNGILQVYFSHASAKLNEVIKTLTVIATIGLPPLVIASIYGMNFKHMPELFWEHGYFFSLGLMSLSSVIVLTWMKWKKWF